MTKPSSQPGPGKAKRAGSPSPADLQALQAHVQRGEWTRLETRARDLTRRYPQHPAAWHALGIALVSAGKLVPAVFALTNAVAAEARNGEARMLLAVTLHRLGRLDEAIAAYRGRLALRPEAADALSNLADALRDRDRPAEAASAYAALLCVEPASAEAVSGLAAAWHRLGRGPEALRLQARALRLRPLSAEIVFSLAGALHDRGRLAEAIALGRHALCLMPAEIRAHNNLGLALDGDGQSAAASVAYGRALRLRPDYGEAIANLANIHAADGRPTEAAFLFQRAVCLDPADHRAVANLAQMRLHQGQPEAAVAGHARALRLKPDYRAGFSNLLLAMHYGAGVSRAEHVAAARRYGDAVRMPATASPCANDRSPDRRLRIGYVSPDFRRHPVAFFLLPVLEAHDRRQVEIIGYAAGSRTDDWTRRLEAQADGWRSLAMIGDRAADAMIREDGIDVLVDLSGHTGSTRLALFARRPAPVQLAWLGYWATTGLSAIDAVVMDDILVPPGAEDWFVEEVERIPGGRFSYRAPDDAPDAAPPPILRRGAPTFGCFNNPAKITPAVMALWSSLLNGVPGSRLILKWLTFGSADERARIAAAFAAAGLAPERLELRPCTPHRDMLAEYGDIDVALDPFPFSGGTTSYEALWMGVPVVTLPGPAPVSRQTLALLSTLGLDEFAADSPPSYLRIAAALAGAPERLARLRSTLRERMRASPACDGRRVAAALEDIYRRRWQRWLQAPPTGG